ncbi:MAG: hypothetical protein O3A63_02325 [Proteobacteria bacterium]|nr:hypothetical protein [Pseudomonadota bacterium]
MLTAARIIAALPGIAMLASAFNWLSNPQAAAESLGMPLLDGMARSTQVGDFSAFFLAATVMIFAGIFTTRSTWLYAAGLLLGLAAFGRTIAYLFHDAALATQFIGIEVVMMLILVGCGYAMGRARPQN